MRELKSPDLFFLANHRAHSYMYNGLKFYDSINICVDGGESFFKENSMIFAGDFDSSDSLIPFEEAIFKASQNISDFEFVLKLLPKESIKIAFGFLGGNLGHDHVNKLLCLEYSPLCLVSTNSLMVSVNKYLKLNGDYHFSVFPQSTLKIEGAKYSGLFSHSHSKTMFVGNRMNSQEDLIIKSRKPFLVTFDVMNNSNIQNCISKLISFFRAC